MTRAHESSSASASASSSRHAQEEGDNVVMRRVMLDDEGWPMTLANKGHMFRRSAQEGLRHRHGLKSSLNLTELEAEIAMLPAGPDCMDRAQVHGTQCMRGGWGRCTRGCGAGEVLLLLNIAGLQVAEQTVYRVAEQTVEQAIT